MLAEIFFFPLRDYLLLFKSCYSNNLGFCVLEARILNHRGGMGEKGDVLERRTSFFTNGKSTLGKPGPLGVRPLLRDAGNIRMSAHLVSLFVHEQNVAVTFSITSEINMFTDETTAGPV